MSNDGIHKVKNTFLPAYLAKEQNRAVVFIAQGVVFVGDIHDVGNDFYVTATYIMVVPKGSNARDPVANGLCNAPTRPATDEATYTYSGWSSIPTDVQANVSVTAVYDTSWRVRYKNWDGTVLQTKWVANGGNVSYTGSTPTRPQDERYTYTFSAWSGNQNNITAPTDLTATYTSSTRYYTVTYVNDNGTTLQTVNNIPYGGSAAYTGSTPSHSSGSADYQFTGFQPIEMTVPSCLTLMPEGCVSLVRLAWN